MGNKDSTAPGRGQVAELEKQECRDLIAGIKAAQGLGPLGAIEYPTHIFVKTQDGKLWIINRVRNCLILFSEGN